MKSVTVGRPSPLGATIVDGGVNFSLFSRTATRCGVAVLRPRGRRQAVARRCPRSGHQPHLPLLAHVRARCEAGADLRLPRARAERTRRRACGSTRPRCCSIRTAAAWSSRRTTRPSRPAARRQRRDRDEERGRRLRRPTTGKATRRCDCPSARTVIYEMHVRGFTRHPNSGVKEPTRGTYAGLIEKIPYLKDLGITAVELLPIHAFDTHACPPGSSTTGAISPSRTSRRTRSTAPGATRSAR